MLSRRPSPRKAARVQWISQPCGGGLGGTEAAWPITARCSCLQHWNHVGRELVLNVDLHLPTAQVALSPSCPARLPRFRAPLFRTGHLSCLCHIDSAASIEATGHAAPNNKRLEIIPAMSSPRGCAALPAISREYVAKHLQPHHGLCGRHEDRVARPQAFQ